MFTFYLFIILLIILQFNRITEGQQKRHWLIKLD